MDNRLRQMFIFIERLRTNLPIELEPGTFLSLVSLMLCCAARGDTSVIFTDLAKKYLAPDGQLEAEVHRIPDFLK